MHYLARLREKRHSNYDLDNIMKYAYMHTFIHTHMQYIHIYVRTQFKKEKKTFSFSNYRLHLSDSEQCAPEAPTRQR